MKLLIFGIILLVSVFSFSMDFLSKTTQKEKSQQCLNIQSRLLDPIICNQSLNDFLHSTTLLKKCENISATATLEEMVTVATEERINDYCIQKLILENPQSEKEIYAHLYPSKFNAIFVILGGILVGFCLIFGSSFLQDLFDSEE